MFAHEKEFVAMAVKPIPDGYHTATPYLIVRGAAKALEFYKQAFGAQELFRMPMPNGQVGHAEIQIGHVWTVATHKEDLSQEEMGRRAEAFMKQQGGCG